MDLENTSMIVNPADERLKIGNVSPECMTGEVTGGRAVFYTRLGLYIFS